MLAYLLSPRGTHPQGALWLGFLVWFGFEAMAVVGSVLHENYPLGRYVIHVGDALQATLLMALILGAWRRGRRREVDSRSAACTTPERCLRKASKQRSA